MAEYTQEQREQAARVLEKFQQGVYGYVGKVDVALRIAIACLRSPGASPDVDGKAGGWVRTSERVPAEEDADKDGLVFVLTIFGNIQICHYEEVDVGYEYGPFYPYWMPLPALPEVDNG